MSEVEIDPKTLKSLLDAFDASDWEEMTLTLPGGDGLHLSRNPDSPGPASFAAPVSAPAAPPTSSPPPPTSAEPGPVSSSGAPDSAQVGAPSADQAIGVPVTSTTVGIFWAAPAPGAPPFVEIGDKVSADDTVGIVEVMKLMNHVPSGVDGVVTAILVGNGEAVEFGQALVLVDPQG